ncbi:hypothetical protein B5C39_01270 [Mesomycoplasma hyopneumoniae]|nr:hypothetical protein [Mesomycoplasma hyopneumoniae]MXR33719.1 hypothetical protein [Mesomycoplasma hyopneumoniae]MXR34981.1 hypothetical protein [Mesomycoplasma hyopneumoniae]OWG16211.1 hypothetical protein B5C39_01270 [Mesomycoplasma hyopneumoniae]
MSIGAAFSCSSGFLFTFSQNSSLNNFSNSSLGLYFSIFFLKISLNLFNKLFNQQGNLHFKT